jgi:uncharacterized protein YgbK (DUF1537 family)
MRETLAERWFAQFMETVRQHPASPALQEAAQRARLTEWTRALTAIVVGSCEAMAWKGVAKGHKSTILPVPRQEFLGLDVVAFEPAGERRWRFPVAVFELENSTANDRVAYSLWKVLCVRSQLRVVFCYRQDSGDGSKLVRHLAAEVARAMEIPERTALTGETLVVVGSRDETKTFPYGFFKDWLFDANVGRFNRA